MERSTSWRARRNRLVCQCQFVPSRGEPRSDRDPTREGCQRREGAHPAWRSRPPAMELRGREERLFEAIPGRIRMALAYYRPLVDVEGIEFRLHGTSLYNSIFRYDDQMLVNQHIYGTYGYMAPILHLRRIEGADLFETYIKSFKMVWEQSYPYQPDK